MLFIICLCANVNAQQGFGTSSPNPNAAIDISSANADKGLLLPRVALVSTNSVSPLAAFVSGMVVYNTATTGSIPNNVTPGLYYCDGSKWIRTVSTVPDQTIDVTGLTSGLSSPNSFAGAVFTPNSPANTDYIYINTTDGTLWSYNGSQYVSYVAPVTTAWYLAGGTTDAGANKTSAIYRDGIVGIGTTTPKGALDVNSTTGAFIPPRMTTAQRNLLSTPPAGAIIFNSSVNQLQVNTGTSSVPVWSSTSGTNAAVVPAGTAVALDNLRVAVVNSGAQFQLATVSGTMSAEIFGYTTYGNAVSSAWFSTYAKTTITTTLTHPFSWIGQVTGNFVKCMVRDIANNKLYEINISSTGAGFSSNIIEIRRIL